MLGAVATPGVTASGASDYKALVCLFLAGGNDANNLIIPNDSASYATYAASRGALALPQAGLLGISPATTDGRAWALHPSMPELQSLFANKNVALMANVGTLVVPTNKTQYNSAAVPLPFQLYSHSDQQVEWMSSVPDKQFTTGWGGRLADLTNAFNTSNSISMSISLNGQNSFQVGKSVAQYAVSTTGAINLTGYTSTAGSAAYERTRGQADVLASANNGLFQAAFGNFTTNAVTDSSLLAAALSGALPFTTAFPTSSLGQQLKMIARLVAAAPRLGLKRQIFFARIGGWDLHDAQLTPHAALLADVSKSLAAFYQATVEMSLADSVTTFTASDFGRTLNTNGDGSDHGWGSHHIVMGGAVKGGDIYGKMPTLTINGPDDTGRGRWIPTTSVDEYSATLATWFGVSNTDLSVVLPNIGRFANPNLGFMG